MPKSSRFPYGIAFHKGGKVATFPAAEVTFFTKAGEPFSLFLVVDSGAFISALPKGDARVLGIKLKEGTPAKIAGISGKGMSGWQHQVPIRLGENELRLPVVFLNSARAPRVLGREGIFDRFSIIFQERQRRTGFIVDQTKDDQAVSNMLDQI